MDSNNTQVCPWCQTEIVWDPEIGPEEQCPHCLNEIGNYRTINVDLNQPEDEFLDDDEELEESVSAAGPSDDLDDLDLLDDYEDDNIRDPYSERITACMDEQETAPECTNCHELMLHAGQRRVSANEFKPVVPKTLGVPFLEGPYTMDVYVCPSCFKTDEYLTKEDQLKVIKIFSPEA